MQSVSRRVLLTTGIGVTAVAAVAAGGYGLVESGILPGTRGQLIPEAGRTRKDDQAAMAD